MKNKVKRTTALRGDLGIYSARLLRKDIYEMMNYKIKRRKERDEKRRLKKDRKKILASAVGKIVWYINEYIPMLQKSFEDPNQIRQMYREKGFSIQDTETVLSDKKLPELIDEIADGKYEKIRWNMIPLEWDEKIVIDIEGKNPVDYIRTRLYRQIESEFEERGKEAI